MDEGRVMVIPRHLVFVKFADIPSLEESEIGKMAEFQALKEVPHPREDLIVGYRNLGSYKSGFSSLMLAIANKKMVLDKMHEKKILNIKIESIKLHTELMYLFLLKKGVISHEKVYFVVYIGEEDSEIMILNKTRPIFSRGFRDSGKFLEEIDRSILVYERDKDNPRIDERIVIYASGMDTKEAIASIRGHFTASINFYEYSEDLLNVDLPAEIELLPKEISDKNKRSKKTKEQFVTCSLIGAAAILFFACLSFNLYEKNKMLQMISADLDELKPEIERLDRLLKKTEIANNHKIEGKSIIEILQQSCSAVPVEYITISGLDYDGGENIYYKGTSRGMQAILGFIKTLEGLNHFEKVEIDYASKKKVKGEEYTDFSIKGQLSAFAKEEASL